MGALVVHLIHLVVHSTGCRVSSLPSKRTIHLSHLVCLAHRACHPVTSKGRFQGERRESLAGLFPHHLITCTSGGRRHHLSPCLALRRSETKRAVCSVTAVLRFAMTALLAGTCCWLMQPTIDVRGSTRHGCLQGVVLSGSAGLLTPEVVRSRVQVSDKST